MNYKTKIKGSGQARPGRAGAAAHLLMENIK